MKKFLTKICVLLSCLFVSSSTYAYTKVNCGKIQKLPYKVLELSNLIITVMQIAVPVILVLMGGIDFVKAISSQKEDEIKKAQITFVKRLILGALVYFIVVIVKFIISVIGNENSIWGCVECFVSKASLCK